MTSDSNSLSDLTEDGSTPNELERDFLINELLPNLVVGEKTALIIDGNNIYRRAKLHGMSISYHHLSLILEKRCKLAFKCMYTAIMVTDPSLENWINYLKSYNFDIVSKHVKTKKVDGQIIPVKGQMDVEITIGALSLDDDFKHVIIATCDDSFTPLVKKLKERSDVKVSVMGMPVNPHIGMPQGIIESCDTYYNLLDLRDFISYKKDD